MYPVMINIVALEQDASHLTFAMASTGRTLPGAALDGHPVGAAHPFRGSWSRQAAGCTVHVRVLTGPPTTASAR